MDIRQAIHATFSHADMLVAAYLKDLTDAELLVRPVPSANHIAWQLGHLISSERYMADKAIPGSVEPLDAEFERRHTKETAGSDDPAAFYRKDEYAMAAKQVRAGVLRAVERLAPEEFDRPVSGLPPMIRSVGDALLFMASHWLMHVGQWAVTRRKLGRAPLF
jgi:hypothetical protein